MKTADKKLIQKAWTILEEKLGGPFSSHADRLNDALKQEQKDSRDVSVRADKPFVQLSLLHQLITNDATAMQAKALVDFRMGIQRVFILAAYAGFNRDTIKEDADTLLDIFHREL